MGEEGPEQVLLPISTSPWGAPLCLGATWILGSQPRPALQSIFKSEPVFTLSTGVCPSHHLLHPHALTSTGHSTASSMPRAQHCPSSTALLGERAGPGRVPTALPLPPVPHGRVLLQRGAQRGDLLGQALQDRVLHLGLVGAVKALEGVGRIQGVNLGGAVGGRLEGMCCRGRPEEGSPAGHPGGFGNQIQPQTRVSG